MAFFAIDVMIAILYQSTPLNVDHFHKWHAKKYWNIPVIRLRFSRMQCEWCINEYLNAVTYLTYRRNRCLKKPHNFNRYEIQYSINIQSTIVTHHQWYDQSIYEKMLIIGAILMQTHSIVCAVDLNEKSRFCETELAFNYNVS